MIETQWNSNQYLSRKISLVNIEIVHPSSKPVSTGKTVRAGTNMVAILNILLNLVELEANELS